MTSTAQTAWREPEERGVASPAADVDTLPLGVLVVDGQGRVISTNAAWRELTGLGERQSRMHGWLQCLDEPDRDSLLEGLLVAADCGEPVVADRPIQTADGRQRWMRWWVRPDGEVPGERAVVVVADVDDDHWVRAALQAQATHDPLTGLMNRAQFFELTEHAMRRRQRHPSPLAVLFVDLDRFKEVNDRFGHRGGDRALIEVAHVLRRVVRPADALARIGGDEFAVLCDDLADHADARAVARRIHEALDHPLAVGDGTCRIGASVGIAFLEPTDAEAEALVERADLAMYEEKRTATPATGGHDVVVDVTDHVVRSLFDVGLVLAAGGRQDDRIRDACDRIDRLVSELRARVLDRVQGDGVVH